MPLEPVSPVAAGPDVIVARFGQQADLSAAAAMPRGADRRTAAFQALTEAANVSQAPAIDLLEDLRGQGLVRNYESMFLPNAVLVEPMPGRGAAVQQALAGVATVQHASRNVLFGADGADQAAGVGRPLRSVPNGIAWSVRKIGADKAQAAGWDGTGITVGVVDSGLDSEHPLIAPHYRGTQADGSQLHDHNWLDPLHYSDTPYDDVGHATHVAATIAGGDERFGSGVAPGAKVIAAKAGDARNNDMVATLKALQFMLAPTRTDGRDPDPRLGADVVNNSWGDPDGLADGSFDETWHGLIAAGIVPVKSAGNQGGAQGATNAAPGDGETITVAATNRRDLVATFSSAGRYDPAPADPLKRVPLIAAPGRGITSAVPGGGVSVANGTSMAAPHVTGAVAALLQADYDAPIRTLKAALAGSAKDIGREGADPDAGYGRISLPKAIALLQGGTAEEQFPVRDDAPSPRRQRSA